MERKTMWRIDRHQRAGRNQYRTIPRAGSGKRPWLTGTRAALLRSVLAVFAAFALGEAVFAQETDLQAKFEKGVYLYDRGGVVRAMSMFRQAAEKGHVGAQLRLGYILDIAGNDREALEWFERARDQGSAKGAYRLGRLYATGEAGEPDPEAAFELYQEAAEKGYGQAMYALASAHEQGGLGLTANEQKALRWYRRAAETGKPDAIRRLMGAHAEGELGLSVDEAAAEKWRKRLRQEQEDDQDST